MNYQEWKLLQPVWDSEEVNQSKKKLNKVITGWATINKLFIKKLPDWVAIATESGDHFGESDIENLLQAVGEHGYPEIIAVAFENLNGIPPAFKIPATLEAIEEFHNSCGLFWFVLYSGEPDWVIVCTKLDYLVVAGRLNFVEKFLGCKIEQALTDFDEYMSGYSERDPFKKYLTFVRHQLFVEYPLIEPGLTLNLL